MPRTAALSTMTPSFIGLLIPSTTTTRRADLRSVSTSGRNRRSKHGNIPRCTLMPGDPLEHRRAGGQDGRIVGYGRGQRRGPAGVDQDMALSVSGPQRPLHHDITLGDEHPRHVAS